MTTGDTIYAEYEDKKRALKEARKALEKEEWEKIQAAEKACDGHVDDGGFMFGQCKKCGAYLG